MYLAAHRGTRIHAPENTLPALISGYTGGGEVLEFDLQFTRDEQVVLAHDGTTTRMTGGAIDGRSDVHELTLEQLRTVDWSVGVGSPGLRETRAWPNTFRYFHARRDRLPPPTLREALQVLPIDVPLLVELKHNSVEDSARAERFALTVAAMLADSGAASRTVTYSMSPTVVAAIRRDFPEQRVCAFNYRRPLEEQLDLLREQDADGLVLQLADLFDANMVFTEFGQAFHDAFVSQELRAGAVLYPYTGSGVPWVLTADQLARLREESCVWSCAVDSVLDVEQFARHRYSVADLRFPGREPNISQIALGYAKRNRWCQVRQDDGIVVDLLPYDGDLPPDDFDGGLDGRVGRLERDMTYALSRWPFYSGGGLGLTTPIGGSFVAEVDYEVRDPMTQAVTLEMAALNVDPGEHQEAWDPDAGLWGPSEQDSFFDPHGAPPYVGVEHDEDDGYRINWNLGTQYENNRYGQSVGDGSARGGTLRLERRGPFFSAYYRNEHEAPDWICVGGVRNDSLNPTVYLRCVAKRWRQRAGDTFHPVRPNQIKFRQLRVWRIHHTQGA